MSLSPLSYRRDIDGLRALAVLAVCLFHANPKWVTGGYLGVDIFFVISGFLITSLIVKDQAAGLFKLRHFWERRARRILPALFVMIICVVIAGGFVLLAPDYKNLGRQVISQSIFSSNFLFAYQSGYFDLQSQTKPLLHTWSLAVEEQFYLLFPLVMIAAFKYAPQKIPLILCAGFICSYLMLIYGSFYYPYASFYLLPGRASELLLGALIVFSPAIKLGRFERELLGVASLLMIIVGTMSAPSSSTNPWAVMLLPCFGTALLLWLGKQDLPSMVSKGLSFPLFTFIGLISYSLYLWHWPVFVYAEYLSAGPLSVGVIVALLGLSLVMATLSWKFIETPVREKKILATSDDVFKATGVCLLFFLISGSVLYFYKGFPERFSDQVNAYADAVYDINPRQQECDQRKPDEIAEHGLCKLGLENKPPEFLVFGDSYADALMPLLGKIAQDKNMSGLFASYNSCPPIFDVGRPDQQKSFDCRGFNDEIRRQIRKTGVKKVLLVARWSAYLNLYLLNDDTHAVPKSFDENRKIFETHLIDTIKFLKDEGVDVGLVMETPGYAYDVPRHLATMATAGLDTTGSGQSFADYAKRLDMMKPIVRSVPVKVIELTPLCLNNILCVQEKNGISLYRDSHHLSTKGALLMEPAFTGFFAD